MQAITMEAPSKAAFAKALDELDHNLYAVVTATESGTAWAVVDVSPMTDTARAVFPNYLGGGRGDTRKRGQSGVVVQGAGSAHAYSVVVERARRMAS